MAGTRIIAAIEHQTRRVLIHQSSFGPSHVIVHVTELIWSNGGRGFDVYRHNGDGTITDITPDSSLPRMPTDRQIASLKGAHDCGHPQCDVTGGVIRTAGSPTGFLCRPHRREFRQSAAQPPIPPTRP